MCKLFLIENYAQRSEPVTASILYVLNYFGLHVVVECVQALTMSLLRCQRRRSVVILTFKSQNIRANVACPLDKFHFVLISESSYFCRSLVNLTLSFRYMFHHKADILYDSTHSGVVSSVCGSHSKNL